MNSRLREYNALLHRLRLLEDKGREESEEAEVLRETMDDCWRGLSEEDCEEVRKQEGLTESL